MIFPVNIYTTSKRSTYKLHHAQRQKTKNRDSKTILPMPNTENQACRIAFDIFKTIPKTTFWDLVAVELLENWGPSVRLQNLPWSKTGLVSRQVLHPLSKLQNWIWSKTGRYKTGLVSNTKIEASLRATKPKTLTVKPYLWHSRNIYSKWKGRFSADAKPV